MKRVLTMVLIIGLSLSLAQADAMHAHDWEFGWWTGALFDACQDVHITYNGANNYTVRAEATSLSLAGIQSLGYDPAIYYDYNTKIVITYDDGSMVKCLSPMAGKMDVSIDAHTINVANNHYILRCDSYHRLDVFGQPNPFNGCDQSYTDIMVRITQFYELDGQKIQAVVGTTELENLLPSVEQHVYISHFS